VDALLSPLPVPAASSPSPPAPLADVQSFYERGWKDISSQYFLRTAWPSSREISAVVKDDAGFLVLYRLLCFRHTLMTLADQPAIFSTYAEAWNAYKAFFDFVVDPSSSASAVTLPHVWVYDILCDNLPFYYQKYHQLRATAFGGGAAAAAAGGAAAAGADGGDEEASASGGSGSAVPTELVGISESDAAAAWSLADVLAQLHRVAEKTDAAGTAASGKAATAYSFRDSVGYFALATLGRLYSKLGDYAASLEAVKPLNVFAPEGALFAKLQKAHLTVQHTAGFALAMSRRYEEAAKLLARTLLYFQRNSGIFNDRDTNVHPTLRRTADKMLALLALAVAALPGGVFVDDYIRKPMRDRHGEKIDRIIAGATPATTATAAAAAPAAGGAAAADGADASAAAAASDAAAAVAAASAAVVDLFELAAPSYLTWSPAPLPPTTDDEKALFVSPAAVQEAHLAALAGDIAARVAGVAPLRSFLRLYTNIDVAKLADYTGSNPDAVR